MLTEARKGEIALKIFRLKIMKEGFTFDQNTRREVGNTAAEIGISLDEALQFIGEIVGELLAENLMAKNSSRSAAKPRGNKR